MLILLSVTSDAVTQSKDIMIKQIAPQTQSIFPIRLIYKSLPKYGFIKRISSGVTLLVGEGNLSFTCALARKIAFIHKIITSTHEKCSELSDETKHNVRALNKMKIHVMHGIDGTKLHDIFRISSIDTIIFQFPHTGSREPINGKNSNYVLVYNFLNSSFQMLKKGGAVLITIVDNDYYNDMFKLEKLAILAGFRKPTKYAFDPNDYIGYKHTMTHHDGSALENHNKFATWEFKL